MNEMFTGVAITILAIGATRMYRSLCQHGSLTEYTSSNVPQLLPTSNNPQYKSTSVYGPIHFAAATTTNSSGTGTTSDTRVFVQTDHIQLDLVPSTSESNPALVHDNTKNKNSHEMA